jgi:hypothetical protein
VVHAKHSYRRPEYSIWASMKKRFKGKVCERWCASFEAFFEDMGPRPSKDLDLGRIDLARDYEPANCQWMPRNQTRGPNRKREEKRRRRLTNHSPLLTVDGVTKRRSEWEREMGLKRGTIRGRQQRGWDRPAARRS